MSGVQGSGVDLYSRARLPLVLAVTGANAIVANSLPSGYIALTDGLIFYFESVADNTGAVTLDVGNGVAVPVKNQVGGALVAGDIVAGAVVEVFYDLSLNIFRSQISPARAIAAAQAAAIASAAADATSKASAAQAAAIASAASDATTKANNAQAAAIASAASDATTKASNAQAAAIAASAIGFTPVQQNGGIGQLANKLYFGYDGTVLRLTIDSTDMGGVALLSRTEAIYSAEVTPIPAAGVSIVAGHGQASAPAQANLLFTCLSAEQNFAVGDVVEVVAQWNGSVSSVTQPWKSAAQIGWTLSSANDYMLVNKTNGNAFTPAKAGWSYRTVIRK